MPQYDENTISGFFGEYRFLSNFWYSTIKLKGLIVEHAFQAMKTLDENERIKISKSGLPATAKMLGKKVKLRDDWEAVKRDVMYYCVLVKFRDNVELKNKLLETGDKRLIEENTWGDRIWGMTRNKDNELVGQNMLGEILMQVRDKLRIEN